MKMDAEILAERILLDIKNIFKRDPLIDEFDIVVCCEPVRNKCPVIHIDHKMALEDWCVKHVYIYAYTKFFKWRMKKCKSDLESVIMWTCAILLINPEIETAWNARKEFVNRGVLDPTVELKFSEVVLSRKPKSSPCYAHRKWVIEKMQKESLAPCALQELVQQELVFCFRVAQLYPNNYYGWCHRSWVINELCNSSLEIVMKELSSINHWASNNVSDHCGFHYKQSLITTLANHCLATDGQLSFHNLDDNYKLLVKALKDDLELLFQLQTLYSGHETLWYHRRFVLTELNKLGTKMGIFKSHKPVLGELPIQEGKCLNRSAQPEVLADDASNHELNREIDISLSRDEILRCKRHKLQRDGKETIFWDAEEEECFVNNCYALASCEPFERSLIERHVRWLRFALGWSVSLKPT